MSDDGDSPTWQERAESGLRWITDASATERILISIAAFVAAIFVGALIILFAGWFATCGSPFLTVPVLGTFCYDPIKTYLVLFKGAFGSPFNVALTLKATTLLIFTGLSVAIAFRGGIFNIGSQGQLVLGALATSLVLIWVGPYVPGGILGGLMLIPFGLLVGAITGGLYGAIPGALKAYADANEVITTIMLNFIATGVAFFLVKNYFQDPTGMTVQTKRIPESARLPSFFFAEGTPFSLIALAVALGLVVGMYLLLGNTSFGYDLRASGLQPEAAEYSGVDADKMIVATLTLSGALAGVGGAVWVLMTLGRWTVGIPGLGFDGITVSILAGNNPLGVTLAALVFGMLQSGSVAVQFNTAVPRELAGVLRGLIILFIAMPEFFRMIGRYIGVSGGGSGPVATDGGTPSADVRTSTNRESDGGEHDA